jgi:hypothetical protein
LPPSLRSSGGSSLDLAPDFDEFCALLSARRVEYVIVGAHALAFHGPPRFTGDLDILVRLQRRTVIDSWRLSPTSDFPPRP